MLDEYGMPVPGDENPLPWRMCGLFEIMSSNETYVSELGESLGDIDVEFIVHAANWIIPCREIVRRLAEWCLDDPAAGSYSEIAEDAARLWAKMREDVKGGDQ